MRIAVATGLRLKQVGIDSITVLPMIHSWFSSIVTSACIHSIAICPPDRRKPEAAHAEAGSFMQKVRCCGHIRAFGSGLQRKTGSASRLKTWRVSFATDMKAERQNPFGATPYSFVLNFNLLVFHLIYTLRTHHLAFLPSITTSHSAVAYFLSCTPSHPSFILGPGITTTRIFLIPTY